MSSETEIAFNFFKQYGIGGGLGAWGVWALIQHVKNYLHKQNQILEKAEEQRNSILKEHQEGYSAVLSKSTDVIEQNTRQIIRLDSHLDHVQHTDIKLQETVLAQNDALKSHTQSIAELKQEQVHMRQTIDILFDKQIKTLQDGGIKNKQDHQNILDKVEKLKTDIDGMPKKLKDAMQKNV